MKRLHTARAWIEIDQDALYHNVDVLRQSSHGELMAVVKANAYGHGDLRIVRMLQKHGVLLFAVASLEEAIHLRRHGIFSDILILGYTPPEYARIVARYRLIQTVVDEEHAKLLNEAGRRIRVHIKVDTGMHRLGVSPDAMIRRWWEAYPHLRVEGTYSHLCVCDSLNADDMEFTREQIRRFFALPLPGSIHLQASYGILNYPDLCCDMVRAGIALYGVRSSNDGIRMDIELKPVLSLHARVASVRTVPAGDTVGYGRAYLAKEERRVAAVTIGYGDGIPRQYDGDVLLHGRRARILGRVCMDQLMIDVTDIPQATAGDTVTLIGTQGTERIMAEEVAGRCGTITNELLCRLGSRLSRIRV